MKTIKVIDLLNMISKGEEVPNKIIYKYKNKDFYEEYHLKYNKKYKAYYTKKDDKPLTYLLADNLWNLNDEVEILEEEKKIPEIIHWHEENGVGNDDDAFYVDVNDKSQYVDSEYDSWEMTVILKINEIIDYLDYLKSKGE